MSELLEQDTSRSSAAASPLVADLKQLLARREATIGVIGLGYVGLPLVLAMNSVGFRVIGFDIDAEKVRQLNAGESYIGHISPQRIADTVATGRFEATADITAMRRPDAILICVPTPLNRNREPDTSYIVRTTESLAPHVRRGQLVILESTTYPGTTSELMRPVLERGGLRSGRDFFLAYSPEREDPGNESFSTSSTPKVVGGDGPDACALACTLYDQFVVRTVPVSSLETAEAVKLTENIFRAVNIALVNELKIVYEAMGIDVWEVIEAAKTKPFGYMPFYPGPGLGGHCIPIDPFYLTWKAREFEISTRFIELAGEINTAMPGYVVNQLAQALDRRLGRGLNGAKILALGVAYKKNVDDIRESASLKVMDMLEKRGAEVSYYDPHVREIPPTREHPRLTGQRSIDWSPQALAGFDAALILTDHAAVDYLALVKHSSLVVDTRNATRAVTGVDREKIVKS
jgi:UDP-N-acetyl-D-glucosamine dehydrogenase